MQGRPRKGRRKRPNALAEKAGVPGRLHERIMTGGRPGATSTASRESHPGGPWASVRKSVVGKGIATDRGCKRVAILHQPNRMVW